MFGYIYKTIILNPKSSLYEHFYIGQKQSPCIVEHYFGSGKKLRDYFNKHCNRKWSRHIYKEEAEMLGLHREILATAANIDELNNLEEYYVNKELDNPLCLNLMTGGLGRIVKEEVIKSMAQTKRNRQFKWWTNGKEIKMSKCCPGDGFVRGKYIDGYNWYNNGEHNVYCKECPPGFALGTKPTTIGKAPWNKGIKTNIVPWNKNLTKEKNEKLKQISIKCFVANKGKHFSAKTEFNKGHIPWNKGIKGSTKANSGSFCGEHKGTKWYNNGVKNIRALQKPSGSEWVGGMLPLKRTNKTTSDIGKYRIGQTNSKE